MIQIPASSSRALLFLAPPVEDAADAPASVERFLLLRVQAVIECLNCGCSRPSFVTDARGATTPRRRHAAAILDNEAGVRFLDGEGAASTNRDCRSQAVGLFIGDTVSGLERNVTSSP
jgi:hypothetical protein